MQHTTKGASSGGSVAAAGGGAADIPANDMLGDAFMMSASSTGSVSRGLLGLSVRGRRRLPLVGVRSTAGVTVRPVASFRRRPKPLLGLGNSSMSSNPSATFQVDRPALFFLGVIGPPSVRSVRRPFLPFSTSNFRSCLANSSSVVALWWANTASSARCRCLANSSLLCFCIFCMSDSCFRCALSYFSCIIDAFPCAV